MKFKPYDYQAFTIDKILKTKKMMAILDMGLGKTACALDAVNKLILDRFEVRKVLVIAPLRVAEMTWPEELRKWDQFHELRMSVAVGTSRQREAALDLDADIYCINRENTKWIVERYLEKHTWPFDMIIIDESSSFKDHTSQRFKALRKVTPKADRLLELTGTPSPNGLMDLWSQMFLVDKGERLGPTITIYRNTYFIPGRRNQMVIFDYILKRGGEQAIYKKIRDVAMSLKAEDYIKMPPRIDNVIELKLDRTSQSLYERMERDMIMTLDGQEITAVNAAVVCNKLLQLANGAVYSDDDGGQEKKWVRIHDVKLDALEEIIEDACGKPVIVFYQFKHDLARLYERFKDYHPRTLQTTEDKAAWDSGQIRILLAHPASMGHGLNLQAGGHIIVWFGLTFSLELYLQANARLYGGLRATETVIIHHLVVKGTEDEHAMLRLQQKKIGQDDLKESIKARIQAYKNNR